MNVYDHAHALARALKSSPEYRSFMEAKKNLEADKTAKDMLMDYLNVQMEIQEQKAKGIEVSAEQKSRLDKLFEVINLNLTVKNYLNAEYRFTVMWGDIQKIIFEPLQDLGVLQKEEQRR